MSARIGIKFVAVLPLIAGLTAAQMVITRSSIDGGGGLRSTGGALELSGTIGQPDAGVLSGGDLELTGGFWFEIARADCNEDGTVNIADHASFIGCLVGLLVPAPHSCGCFDLNSSETVDLRDYALFQLEFSHR